jgi:hypothetical protein
VTDPFDKPYWSRLQVELWVCTRSRDAVRLAEHSPGIIRFDDLSLDPDLLDDEEHDNQLPGFANEEELIGTAISRYGCVCSFDDARRGVIVALSDGRLGVYRGPAIGSPRAEFLERMAVVNLWREEPHARRSRAPAPGKVPQSGEARRLPPHSKLVAFLRDHADGTKPESACRKAAGEHFKVTIPDSEKAWRPAWREVPKEKRLPRGQWSRRSRRS